MLQALVLNITAQLNFGYPSGSTSEDFNARKEH